MLTPEFGATLGPLWLQGEYLHARVHRDAGPALDFGGWYAQAVLALTGERRAYRSDRATFEGPKVLRELGRDGGRGAWELALRLSELDLSDAEVDGGRLRDLTAGVNCYPNPLLRLSANVVRVLATDGGPRDGDTPTLYQLRLQLGY